jgi:hypothetical protein
LDPNKAIRELRENYGVEKTQVQDAVKALLKK